MLIGITGATGAGKSTFAGVLATQLGLCLVTSFAHSLRAEWARDTGNSLSVAYSKPTPRWVREALIKYSKEVKSRKGEDYFVRCLNNIIKAYQVKYVVIDDVRFLREAQYIKNSGGIIIHLKSDLDEEEYELQQTIPLADISLDRQEESLVLSYLYGN